MAPSVSSLAFKLALFATVLAAALSLGFSNDIKSADALPQQPAFTILQRQLRSAYDFMPAEKRELVAGYWDQCEFSPMSCLLRRRRRSVQMPMV